MVSRAPEQLGPRGTVITPAAQQKTVMAPRPSASTAETAVGRRRPPAASVTTPEEAKQYALRHKILGGGVLGLGGLGAMSLMGGDEPQPQYQGGYYQ